MDEAQSTFDPAHYTMRVRCAVCDSEDMEFRCWVSTQTGLPTDDCQDLEYWCNHCQEHVKGVTPRPKPQYHHTLCCKVCESDNIKLPVVWKEGKNDGDLSDGRGGWVPADENTKGTVYGYCDNCEAAGREPDVETHDLYRLKVKP